MGEGASAHSSSVKTANNKIPVSSVFNDSERLYRTTQSPVALSLGLIVPRGYMSFGSRGPSEFFFSDTPPKGFERDCVGRHL